MQTIRSVTIDKDQPVARSSIAFSYDNGYFTEDKAAMFRNFANQYAFALWQAGHPDF